jgi:hypothetical protein
MLNNWAFAGAIRSGDVNAAAALHYGNLAIVKAKDQI